MLRHVIAPSAFYTKASNEVVRHKRLNSDAKILVLYVQGLPGECACKPLGELAEKLEIKGRAYQKAKRQLIANGYVHEWRSQGDGGRWVTHQLISNEPLTTAQARSLREDPPAPPPPGARFPAVGVPTGRRAGGYKPVEDHSDKTTPHPPSEAEPKASPEPTDLRSASTQSPISADPAPAPAPAPAPTPPSTPADPVRTLQLARAERVLLSLRHSRRELHLGVGEARALAVEAVKWLERGLSASDLRQAMLAERPENGVHSAVGFLRYRLIHKLPEDPAPPAPQLALPAPLARELIMCKGAGDEHLFRPLGDEHLFRPLGDETECAECRRASAYAAWHPIPRPPEEPDPGHIPWRDRFARIQTAEA
ncbi:hypothetical protein [Streptomyces sp. NPDC048560]|uniref:hypothetical protein n=1 Tax=Streptomyces sp. NPDC048560 TaxID=3155488 RepID=UPI00342EEB81